MAAHSSILAWRIAWTEKPGVLQSLGSQSRTQLKQLSTHEVEVQILSHQPLDHMGRKSSWLYSYSISFLPCLGKDFPKKKKDLHVGSHSANQRHSSD